jgi:hypothetical protein
MLTEMAWERFPKDDNMLQALVLVAHLADCQRAGAEASTAVREVVIVAKEAEMRAAEAATVAQHEEVEAKARVAEATKALEAARASEETTTLANLAEEAARQVIAMLQAKSDDAATVADGPFLGPYCATVDLAASADDVAMTKAYVVGIRGGGGWR